MSDPFDKYRQYDQDLRDAYEDGYAAALDAAREAVSNVLSNGYHPIEAHNTVIEALAAIDALRKGTK